MHHLCVVEGAALSDGGNMGAICFDCATQDSAVRLKYTHASSGMFGIGNAVTVRMLLMPRHMALI